ncbi:unnamed protein product, partial [Prorocentrum cordatum]
MIKAWCPLLCKNATTAEKCWLFGKVVFIGMIKTRQKYAIKAGKRGLFGKAVLVEMVVIVRVVFMKGWPTPGGVSRAVCSRASRLQGPRGVCLGSGPCRPRRFIRSLRSLLLLILFPDPPPPP